MRIYSTFVLIVLISLKANSQSMTMLHVDSLKQALKMVRNDTSSVLIMANLAEGYRGSKPDSAMLYAQQALQLAKKIQFPRGEVLSLLSISVVMRELGNLPQALDIAMKALNIAETHHYKYGEAFSLVRIANVYNAFNDYSEALKYYFKASEKLKSNEDDFLYVGAHFLAGNVLQRMNNLDSALYEVDMASQLVKKYSYKTYEPDIQNAYASIHNKKGDSKLALQYYHQSLLGYLNLKENRAISSCYNDLANFYKGRNQLDSAIYYAKQALEFAQALSYKSYEMRAASILSELYEESNSRLALYYFKMAASAKDSLYNAQKIQAMQTLAFEEQERVKEMQSEKLAFRNKVIQNVLLIGAVFLLITALVLYRNNKLKQRTNTVLAATLSNLKLTQSQLIQSEKMASLGELTAGIAHEIQNPLNFVNNFSEVSRELLAEMKGELDKGNAEDAKELANDVIKNLEKINHHGKRADGIVKGMLQHSRTNSGKKELTDLNALCEEYLRLSYHGYRAKDKSFNAKFEFHPDPTLPKVNVVPQDIGRVILNLINNALYAVNEKVKRETANVKAESSHVSPFTSRYEPLVTITTKNLGDKIQISVKDNGPGIPDSIKEKIFQPFFTTKLTGQGTGLGLSLSYDIVKAHGGEIKLETKDSEETKFTISLPIH
jgi:signal transduction histidine kinase